MKYLILIFIVLFTVSCVATKYDYEYNQNFSKVTEGQKYTVFDKTDRKTEVLLTAIETDSLRGTAANQPFAIAKRDVAYVKKSQPWATAALVAGGTVVVGSILVFGLLVKEFSDGVSGQ